MFNQSAMNQELISGRYRVLGLLGQGCVKDVFRARDEESGAEVALARVLRVDPDRFHREVAAAQKVESKHIPRVLDAFIDDSGVGFMVTELIEGPTLAERIERAPLLVDQALPVFKAFAKIVHNIHESHVLHRDLKLENVILSEESPRCTLKLLDFGIAEMSTTEHTAVGEIDMSGTLGYASPEVLKGELLDARSDVYALGVCFFRMLTGEFPYRIRKPITEYIAGFTSLRRHDFSRLPKMPSPLKHLIRRTLELDKSKRPFMPEVLEALNQVEIDNPLVRGEGGRHLAPISPRKGPLLHPWLRLPGREIEPEHLLLSGWPFAPLLMIQPSGQTRVEAFSSDGGLRWSHDLRGTYRRAISADLDADGVQELYLVGDDRLASLDARGNLRFSVSRKSSPKGGPTLFAAPHRRYGRLLIDGVAFDSQGRSRPHPTLFLEGNGHELVDAQDGVGMGYNGFADQAFRGQFHTPAAIFMRPEDTGFHVAHLESKRRGPATRLYLSIYGPGGARTGRGEVAVSEFQTGDARAVELFIDAETPLFDRRSAPLGMIKGDEANGTGGTAIVPLLNPPAPFSPQVVAFSVPDAKERWRLKLGTKGPGGALLADVDGDGAPELIICCVDRSLILDPQTGQIKGELEALGTPVAYGDPFGTGFAHLFCVLEGAVDIWRGPAILPGLIGWSGLRGDLWGSGCVNSEGVPLGPI